MRTSKTIILMLSVLAIFTAQSFAQATVQSTNEPPVRFNFELSSKWNSEYVSPFGKLVYNKPVVQSEATVWIKSSGIPGKFYLDFWNSTSFDTWNSNPGDEIDYTAGWKGELWKGIGLNLWATYLDFLPVGTMPENGDQIRFFTELSQEFRIKSSSLFGNDKTKSVIVPFVCFEVPRGLNGYEDPNGFRVYSGVKGNWEFIPCWSVLQKINLILDDGATGLSPGTFFDYKVCLNWRVSNWLSVEPYNFRVITPLTDVSDGRKTETVFGAGLVAKF